MNPYAIFWLAYLAVLCLAAGHAFGHDGHFSDEENAWLEAQYAPDGVKCCDRHDAFVGPNVEWRIGKDGYHVHINGTWHPVPAARVMQRTDDNPWPGQAIVTYSLIGGRPYIWCMWPGTVM